MPKITMDGSYFKAETLKELGEQHYTIKFVVKENVAPEDKDEERKWVVYFVETDTGVVLNSTRLSQLTEIFGSNDSDVWINAKVTVYCDPDIRFGGKKVGGVAFKAYQEPSKLFTSKVNLDRN
jgi:hypothetical protein